MDVFVNTEECTIRVRKSPSAGQGAESSEELG